MIFGINTTCDISKLSQITYNNFEISLVVFMPNITTNHAITYTNIAVGIVFLNWEGQILNAFRMTGKNFPEVLKNSSVEIGYLTVF